MSADFKPELSALKSLRPFVFWAQTTLPTVFDDSLSYYEVLTKLTKMVNTLLENTDTTEANVEALATAYDELQAYVNDYFENLDVTTEIDNKLEEWRDAGIIDNMVDSYVAPIIHDYLYGPDDEGGVQKTLEDMLADATESLNNALSTFSSDSRQALNDFERDTRDALTDFEDATDDALDAIPTTVDAWLDQNFTNPSSPPLDATLSLENAAAESKATGERCDQLEDLVMSNNDWINSVSEVVSNQYVLVNDDGTNPRIGLDASSNPLRPMSIANITGGRSYLISCVGNTVGPTTFSPAYAICNLSYDLQDEPVYTILDFYPRAWDPEEQTYEIIRSKSVYIPETIGLQTVNCLILMGNTDITVTPKCGVLSVKTDSTLTDPLLPANSKTVGDALANKLPWPVTEGQKDVGVDGRPLISNGDGTTRWGDTGGDYDQEIAELQSDVSDLETSLNDVESIVETIVKNLIQRQELMKNVGFIRPTGTSSDSSSYRHSDQIYIHGCKRLIITGRFSANASPAVFYDSNHNYISGFTADQGASTTYTYNILVPENAYYFVSSCATGISADYYECNAVFDIAKRLDRCYISPTGDDTNNGASESTPVKTATRAKELLSDFGTLVIMPGDYDWSELGIDFDYFHSIVGIDNPRIISYLEKFTTATLETGYTRVYKAEKVRDAGASSYACLYQHDIADASTVIPESEAHPLHGNRTHRLPSTRIYHASSIAEIEATTDKYMWFLSGNYYYFSCPNPELLETNPIIVPQNIQNYYGIKSSDFSNISFKNFSILYCPLSVSRCSGLLDNIEIGMCTSAYGLSCDYCEALTIKNCNIYGISGSATGDGINAHCDDTTIGRRSVITIENCWLHDCSDDGESSHENCESIHYGTLVEYNGSGITPSGGSSACHGVIARKNSAHPWVVDSTICAGFSCNTDGTALACYDCVSENNMYGYYASEGVAVSKTNATLINCISRNNSNAELKAVSAEMDTYNVTIINANASKHVSVASGGAINVRAIDNGFDSDGVYIKTNAGKSYIAA